MLDFEEHPYWRAPYADDISTLLPRIKRYNEAIREFTSDPENAEFVQGFRDIYRELFITEFNQTGSKDDLTPKQKLKQENMGKAINDLFGKQLVASSLNKDFDVNLAKKLDETIGQNLIRDAGVYRKLDARPSGYNFNYLDPDYIENSLNKLFRDINKPLEPGRDDWYNVAAEFFNRFLFAHPFRDGNGRVARIMLSALLINYSVVPLCFFLWGHLSHKICLHVLAEAHNPLTNNDKLLKSFIIEVVHGALEYCINSLEIQVD